jgi:hypothetical protein
LGAVHEDVPVTNQNPVAGEADHPLDEVAAGVKRVLHDHDVATLWRMDPVVQLGGDEQVAVVQGRVHREPDHVDRLHGEGSGQVEDKGQSKDLDQVAEEAF